MKVHHFLFNAIAVILSMSMIFSCTKPEEQQKTDPTPPPTPKETLVINSGVDTKPTIKQEGGEAKVSFTATENWTASIINTKADSWISLDKTSGSAGKATITITVLPNDTPDDRSATVQIKAGNTTIDIVVSQKGKDSLTTTASKNEFGPEGGELTIEVKANIDFTYSIAEGCKDWVSESGTKALTTTTLKFKIAENEDVKKREGSVTIKSSLGEEVIKVYQSGTEPTIVITKNEYSVKAEGETIQVEVSSNVNVEMAIPDDCDWIKEVETKAISTNTFYLNVSENPNIESRTAKVVFKNVENGLSEEITVTQAGRDAVHVESISLDKTELEITEGDTATLMATVLPENADNKKVIWSCSDESVATVKDGVVSAIKEGEATITAKTEDGGKTATCAVKVKAEVATNPFTISSIGSTSVALMKEGSPDDITLEYRKGYGSWSEYTIGTSVDLEDEEFVQFRAGEGGNDAFINSYYSKYRPSLSKYYFFNSTGLGNISVSGNMMSLLDRNMERLSLKDVRFSCLFSGCDNLIDASKLELPATNLTEYCYAHMFYGCSSLQTTPELPATTLAPWCYYEMFFGCSSLQTAPELPATNLADSCYGAMFYGCTSLQTAPKLPATTLAQSCYLGMFSGCTSLQTVPALPVTTLASCCYSEMFYGCTSLQTAPELPATNLANSCYGSMFYGCTSLQTAPALPATTLTEYCYSGMFSGCTSLQTVPELPATNLTENCYCSMFYGCSSLQTAPELPATNLANSCYGSMFYGCTSLQTAPELPATTLAQSCYLGMFSGCTSLQTAPELPATNLTENCYSGMFSGCSNLNYVKALFETTPSATYTGSWLNGVSSTGTFVKSKNATWNETGPNGIPSGWTVQIAE